MPAMATEGHEHEGGIPACRPVHFDDGQVVPQSGACDAAFGMPGSTVQETERTEPDMIVVTPGTVVNFKASMYAMMNTLNGGDS